MRPSVRGCTWSRATVRLTGTQWLSWWVRRKVAVLRVKEAGVLGGVPQPLQATLGLGAEQVGGGHAEQLLPGEAAEPLCGGVGVEELVGIRVE